MLPDFPKLKAKANQALMQGIRRRLANSSILSQIRNSYQHEGKSAAIKREDSSEERTEYHSASQILETTRDEMRVWAPERLIEKAMKMAEALEEEQTKAFFAVVERAAEESGNTVSAGGKGFQKEQFLEAYGKILHTFDHDTGAPTETMFVMHPDMMAQFSERYAEWQKDEDFVKKFKRIEDEKREEWRAREASRKLVD